MALRAQVRRLPGLLVKDGADVRIISRNRKDLTRSYPTVVAAARKLTARQALAPDRFRDFWRDR